MGYLDKQQAALEAQKNQLTGSIADKAKVAVPAVPKLEVSIPSGLDASGNVIPKTFTCTPDFDAIKSAMPAMPTLPTIETPSLPSLKSLLPTLPKIPKLPTINDLINMIPAPYRAQYKKMVPPPTPAQILAAAKSFAPPLPTLPAVPTIPELETLKSFCKPPAEAPAEAALVPEVKTETVTTTYQDSNGNLVTTSEEVTKTVSPMDTAGVNNKAQVKILGESERQKFVKETIIDINAIITLNNILKEHLMDENTFWQQHTDVTTFPYTADGWSAALTTYQTIFYNIEMLYVKIDLKFFNIFKKIFYMNTSTEYFPKYNELIPKMETDVAANVSKNQDQSLYLTDYSVLMKDVASLNKPDYISNEYEIIYDFFAYFRAYSLWGNYGDIADEKELFANSYNIYKNRFKHMYETFNKCKCEVWTLIGDDAFEKNARRYAENNAKQYQTDIIIDKGFINDTYAVTKFYDPYGKYNFSSSRCQFPALYNEALAKLCIEKLQKTLPPQG